MAKGLIVVPCLDAIMIVDFPKSMRLKTIQVSSGGNLVLQGFEQVQGLDQKEEFQDQRTH